MSRKPDKSVIVRYFQCTDPTMDKFGLWGFKVHENGERIHKTRYEFETREEARESARYWVKLHKPGQWKPEGILREAA